MVTAHAIEELLFLRFQESIAGRRHVFTTEHRGRTLRLTAGSRTAYAGNKRITLPLAPRITHGALMVPFRATAEALGCKVTYHPKTGTIYLNSPKPKPAKHPSH